MARTCAAKTKDGKPCGMTPPKGHLLCVNHDPKMREKMKRVRAKARKRRSKHRRGRDLPDDFVIDSVPALLDVVAMTVRDALKLENSAKRARVLTGLFKVALDAIAAHDLDERLDELEAKLKAQADAI